MSYRRNIDMPESIRRQFEPPMFIKAELAFIAGKQAVMAIQDDMLKRLHKLPLQLSDLDRALIRQVITHEVVIDVRVTDIVDVIISYRLKGIHEDDVDPDTQRAFDHMAAAIQHALSESVGAATIQQQSIITTPDGTFFSVELAAPRPKLD